MIGRSDTTPPDYRRLTAEVEAEGIEPSIPACKTGVFPLALRPRAPRAPEGAPGEKDTVAHFALRDNTTEPMPWRSRNRVQCAALNEPGRRIGIEDYAVVV